MSFAQPRGKSSDEHSTSPPIHPGLRAKFWKAAPGTVQPSFSPRLHTTCARTHTKAFQDPSALVNHTALPCLVRACQQAVPHKPQQRQEPGAAPTCHGPAFSLPCQLGSLFAGGTGSLSSLLPTALLAGSWWVGRQHKDCLPPSRL